MNIHTEGPKRPKLWPPKAFASERPKEPTSSLAPHELRRIVAAMVG